MRIREGEEFLIESGTETSSLHLSKDCTVADFADHPQADERDAARLRDDALAFLDRDEALQAIALRDTAELLIQHGERRLNVIDHRLERIDAADLGHLALSFNA